MSETFIIFVREFNARVRTRAFLIGTLLAPVMMVGLFAVQLIGGGSQRTLVVVNEATPQIGTTFVEILTAPPRSERNNSYRAELREGSWSEQRAALDAEVLAERIDGYVVIPRDVLATTEITYRARTTAGPALLRELESAGRRATQQARIIAAGIPEAQLKELTRGVTIRTARLTASGERAESPGLVAGLTFLSAFFAYTIVVGYGVSILRSVLEEKTSRIAEVLLSSVTAGRLLAGKLLGAAGAAVLQMAMWAAMVAVVAGVLLAVDGSGSMGRTLGQIDFPATLWLALLVFVILGFLLYGAVFAAIGAAVTTEQEAQSLQTIGILPTLLPLILSVRIIEAPAGTLATTLSLVPFTSPIAMPMRMVAAPVPLWQTALSLLLLFAAFVVITWAAGKIFRIGVLSVGRKATFAELWQWVRRPV
jgi:ABC-2 type transport system permease protein